MDVVSRSLVTVYFSKKILDQINSLGEFAVDKISLEEINFEPAAILVPEFDSAEDMLIYLNKRAKELFTFMLDSWCQDWSTLERVFDFNDLRLQEWFDFEFSPMVVDIDYVPLTKEKLIVEK